MLFVLFIFLLSLSHSIVVSFAFLLSLRCCLIHFFALVSIPALALVLILTLAHSFLCSRYDVISFISLLSLWCCPIHFFARQRNESKKGDTGETLCFPFSRFSPVTPIQYDVDGFMFRWVLEIANLSSANITRKIYFVRLNYYIHYPILATQ